MKRLALLLLFLLVILTSQGQMFFIETGKLLVSINYKNSSGESNTPWTGSIRNNLGVGYRQPLFSTPLHVSVEALYNPYFIQGSDKQLGNFFEYDLNCLGTEILFDYEFLKPYLGRNDRQGFSFSVLAGGMADFLVKGTQRINDQVYDLIGKEEFDKPAVFLKTGAMVNYYLSKNYIVFARYRFGRSFLIGNYKDQEQLRYTTHNLNVGLTINLQYRR
jgi:hypothetical protein